MVLRLAWCTPFGPRSDIGAFSRNLLDAARREQAGRLAVMPVVPPEDDGYFTEGPRLALDDRFDPAVLDAFDHPVFNVGNDPVSLGRINRLALQKPGVVILHDVVLHPALAAAAFEGGGGPAAYAALVAAEHGVPGLATLAAAGVLARPPRPAFLPWESGHVASLPLVGPFVAGAAAVVVHSAYAAARIRPLTRAPLLTLGLPFDQKPGLTEAELAAWAEATRRAERPLVVAFGGLARAKCLDVLLRALALAPPALRLLIAGRPDEPGLVEELRALAAGLGLSGRVAVETAVPVARLQQIKREADILVNLRHPNTEGASGSLVEMLDSGKPVVLHPSGCFAEVPEGAALRVASVSDPAALAAALSALAADPERRIALGAAGRAHARRLSGGGYLARLLAFLEAEGAAIRRRQGLHAGRRAASHAALAALDPADAGFAADAARARLFALPLLARARGPDAAAFLALPRPELRGLIVVGLLGQAENPWAIAAADALLAAGDRPAAFRATAQALALRDLAEGGPPPDWATLDAAEPAALPLLAALSPEALAAGLVACLLGRLPSRAEIAGLADRLRGGERAAALAAALLDSEPALRRGLPEAERRDLLGIAARLAAPWEAGVPRAAPLSAEAPLLPGPGLEAALRGPWGPMGVDGAASLGPSAALALRLPPSDAPARRIALDLRLEAAAGRDGVADRGAAAGTGVPQDAAGPGRLAPSGGAAALRVWAAGRPLAAPPLPLGRPARLELSLPAALRPEDGVPLLLDGWEAGVAAIVLRGAALLGEGEAAPAPLLPEGRRIAFTPAEPLAAALLAGPWYGLEPGGVWTRGPAGRLVARLPPGDWRLLLELRVEGIAAQGPKRVVASAEGVGLAEAVFADSAPRRIAVPLGPAPRGPGGEIRLDLDCGAAANLAALGLGPDSRDLGVMLVAATLERDAP
jgi:glycosyltransferase involved in cell wall biosynthesis